MNIRTQERQLTEIKGLHIETGGSVVGTSFVDLIPDTAQPSTAKVCYVFGGAIIAILVGTGIGWSLCAHFNAAEKQKTEIAATTAKLNLAQNQANIDNFCLQNSSLGKSK